MSKGVMPIVWTSVPVCGPLYISVSLGGVTEDAGVMFAMKG